MTDIEKKALAQVNWSEKDEKYWVKDLNGENLFFDSSLDAKDAARRIETERAVADEVDRIVTWLRGSGDPVIANIISAQIERGEYK